MRLFEFKKQRTRNLFWGLFFVSPWIFHLFAFLVYPIFASLYFSFTDFNMLLYKGDWIGLGNYRELFEGDPMFFISMRNTLWYSFLALSIGVTVDIIAALLLNMKVWGLAAYRTILFLPAMVPGVAAAMTWVWILNPKHGLLNAMLASIGIDGPYWLASPRTAMISIVMVTTWASGQMILIYLAGLQDIPTHLYEAAEIDGANAWHRMRYVTLPLLTPQVLFNLVMGSIGTLQEFARPYVMTGGGPANSTYTYGMYIFHRAFQAMRMGLASSAAWMLFVVVLILTIIILRSSRRWVVYER
ncbi:MAG: sugar ABC transporter permease [Chloroflexi bacterium]|nr:sugar ABC transporter permease [Chloroflexota bacterium]